MASERLLKPDSQDRGLPNPPPYPFKPAPSLIKDLFAEPILDPSHIYIAHLDLKPVSFKRKIFLVAVAMNLAVIFLFLWRARYILPYYAQLLMSGFGHPSETSLNTTQATWSEIAREILRRMLTFSLDFVLMVFVWPWPVEFSLVHRHGNPLWWRRRIGFLGREIYVRRSREWAASLKDPVGGAEERRTLLGLVAEATRSSVVAQKTGYLTMSARWDLDWAAMVHAHKLVDQEKLVAADAFRCLVLVHHDLHGWLVVDMGQGEDAREEDRRCQVFAFRDALAAVDKEDLFFRWIEVVQFESTRPGGFTEQRQEEVAQQIRDLFAKEGIDFDEMWKTSVGSEGIVGR